MKHSGTCNTDRFGESLTSNRISVILFLIVSLAFTSPVYRNIDYLGMHDMDEAFFHVAVPRDTILKYHQIPLWNPYQCGGNVLLASPQSVFLSPTFLINLVFGDILGIKIKIFFYLFIGLLGMFRLAKQIGIRGVSTYIPSFIFMLNSLYPLNISDGMLLFPVSYMPWAILFYFKSSNRKNIVYSALVLALIFLEGGAYFLFYAVMFMGLHSILSDLTLKRVDKTKKLALICIMAILFCSVKLIPSLEFVREYPHTLWDYSGYSVNSIIHSLFDRDQLIFSPKDISDQSGFLFGISWNWVENGMYIGFIPFILYLMGFVTLGRKHRPLLATSLIFLWLSLGHRAPLSLYGLLHQLPIFESLRVATRFRTPFLLTLSLISGLTASRIEHNRASEKHLKRFFMMLAVLTIVLLVGTFFFSTSRNLIFHVGGRVYNLQEHAHEFSYFRDGVERLYLKIVLNMEILAALALAAALLVYSRISGRITDTQFRHAVVYGLVIFVLCDLMMVNSPIFSDAFTFPPVRLENDGSFFQTENIIVENNYSSEYFKFGEFFHKMRGNITFRSTLDRMSYSSMYLNFLQNRGSTSCINPMGVRIYAIPKESKNYRGEVYLEEGEETAVISYFSPNKIEVEFNTSEENRIVVNQNYFKGWQVKGNKFGRVEGKSGLISTIVQPDEHKIIFYYLPASLIIGAFISLTSLVAAIYFFSIRETKP